MRSIIVMLAISLLACTLVRAQDTIIPTQPSIEALQAEINRLIAENADLRAQLRQRDADRSPTPALIDDMPVAPAPGWKVVFETTTNCQACDVAWARDSPKLLRAKWKVEKELIIQAPPTMRFPRWRVCGPNASDGCFSIEFTTDFASKLRDTVAKIKRDRDDFIPAPAGD